MKHLFLFLLSTVLLFPACSVTDSENVKTSGIWANYRIEMNEAGDVYAYAVLRVGGATGTIVDLSGGEHMECNDVTLTEYVEPITNYHWSRAQVSEDTDGVYEFVFVRTDEEVSTMVELPDPPVIISVENEDTLTTEDDITVTWDDTIPGDYVNITLSGDCIDDFTDTMIPDDGSYSIQDIVYLATFQTECYLDLSISRVILGDVNPAFQSGQATGVAHDSITLHIVEPTL